MKILPRLIKAIDELEQPGNVIFNATIHVLCIVTLSLYNGIRLCVCIL